MNKRIRAFPFKVLLEAVGIGFSWLSFRQGHPLGGAFGIISGIVLLMLLIVDLRVEVKVEGDSLLVKNRLSNHRVRRADILRLEAGPGRLWLVPKSGASIPIAVAGNAFPWGRAAVESSIQKWLDEEVPVR